MSAAPDEEREDVLLERFEDCGFDVPDEVSCTLQDMRFRVLVRNMLEELRRYQAGKLVAGACKSFETSSDEAVLLQSLLELAAELGLVPPSAPGLLKGDALLLVELLLGELQARRMLYHRQQEGEKPVVQLGSFSPTQRTHLEQIFNALKAEYKLRRKMLIHRSEVSLRSFAWSPRGKESKDEINSLITQGHAELALDPQVSLQDLASAKRSTLEDVAGQKTSSGARRFSASVKGVQIGAVPDRGGRPDEMRVEADMPSFKPRAAAGEAGGAGSRWKGGGGGRGGHPRHGPNKKGFRGR